MSQRSITEAQDPALHANNDIVMKVPTLLCSLVAFGLASPAPSQWRQKRAAVAAYQSHTIDQPSVLKFTDWELIRIVIQILMEKFNGLGVILENRYYGQSYPFNTSTTDELRFLTTEQTIADNAYFRQHATFPGINETLNGAHVPWILYGGSLAGAHTAFTMKTYNSIFAGGIGSSATTQALLDYPYWYDPIIKFGPSDCVSRIVNIIDKMDALIRSGNEQGIQQLKDIFGLGALHDIRDFAMTIAFPIGGPMNYPTNTWQELNWDPQYGSDDFFTFCSHVTNVNPPPHIRSVDTALARYSHGEAWTGLGGYAAYIQQTLLPQCASGRIDSTDAGCFGTQNQTAYADVSNRADRSYLYSTCSESGGYQTAPQTGRPSLLSRVLTTNYTQQWCTWAFPPGRYHGIPASPQLEYYNRYGGWNIQAPNLALIDGSSDVWLDLCYHSNLAPQPRRISSDMHPRYLIAGGGHHWDSYGIRNVSAEPDGIREAHLWEQRTVSRFLEFWAKKRD
ncbi:hypothetical protein ACEQ8H_007071 [Pleosporales sp. CAS-2024a]